MVVFHLPTNLPNTMNKVKPNTIDVLKNVSSTIFRDGSKTQLLIKQLANTPHIWEKNKIIFLSEVVIY